MQFQEFMRYALVNSMKNKNTKNLAFSLIELSIVLIIIGLLVAGVVGGKSLIESAKIRAFSNELNGWKQAVFTSLTVNGRLPGDLNNDGMIGPCRVYDASSSGRCVIETYTISSFAEPYNVSSSVPNSYSAPFVDLYLSKIIDFKPDPSNINVAGKGYPYSNVFKDGYFYFTNYMSGSTSYYMKDEPSTTIESLNLQHHNSKENSDPKIFKKIDEKLDDGIYNTGNIRGRCYSGSYSYDSSITNGYKCSTINFKIK